MTKDNKNLRPYQIELIKNARYILKSNKSLIIQGSTGIGKTVLASFMLKALAEQNKRGLFICHRRELIEQASKSFNDFNINHAIIGTGYKKDLENPIQICSALSLFNKLDLIKKPDFIIWDECHHIASSTWSKIFNYFPDAHHIGLTATPQRLDGKGLGKFFEKMVQAPPMRELINQGYLSDFDIYAPSKIDLEGVASKNGDYDQEQLDKVVNKSTITGCAIEHYKKICNNKKAIVFCVSINHSLEVVKKFNDAGIKAAHIDGQMTNKQRDELINKFQDGELKILSNVDIVGEGFDLPAIEAAILLRPTQSLTLYLQQVGRALRRSQGKDKAVILDHAANVLRHKMPDFENIWDLNYDVMKNKKEVKKVISYKSCPECNLVVNKSRIKCNCGNSFKKNHDIIQVDGELEKFIPKELSGNCRKVKRVTLNQVKRIISLYNTGYPPKDIACIIWKDGISKKDIANNSSIVSDIALSKTWIDYPTRPISKDEWLVKNFTYRITKSYEVDKKTNCWLSLLYCPTGHPKIKIGKKYVYIKKYLYESHFRPILDKYTILNKCGNIKCVNPNHIKIITKSEAASLASKRIRSRIGESQYKERLRSYLANISEEGKLKINLARKKSLSIRCATIIIKDINTNNEVSLDSIKEASIKFNISRHLIKKFMNTDKPYKGYLIKSYLPF